MAVLSSLTSPASRRVYKYAIEKFVAWYRSEPRIVFNRIVVVRYRIPLEFLCLAANTINQHLAAVWRLAHEAADAGLLSPDLAAGIASVKGVKQLGQRSGNWLTQDQSADVLRRARGESLRAKRDYAMLAMLFGCGLRRSELAGLEMDDIQTRQGIWAIVDLIGKGGHVRTVPIPHWAKQALDEWMSAARDYKGPNLWCRREDGKSLGFRNLGECRLVRSAKLLLRFSTKCRGGHGCCTAWKYQSLSSPARTPTLRDTLSNLRGFLSVTQLADTFLPTS